MELNPKSTKGDITTFLESADLGAGRDLDLDLDREGGQDILVVIGVIRVTDQDRGLKIDGNLKVIDINRGIKKGINM